VKSSKKFLSKILLTGLILGISFSIIGGIIFYQNAPKLRVIRHIEWSGTIESGFHDKYESGYSERVIRSTPDIQTIFNHNSFFFRISFNHGINKDPLDATIIVTLIEGIPHITHNYVKTNYYNQIYFDQLCEPIHEDIPTKLEGRGYDNNPTDWRDKWTIEVKEFINSNNKTFLLIGQWLFSISLSIILLIISISIGLLLSKIRPISLSKRITEPEKIKGIPSHWKWRIILIISFIFINTGIFFVSLVFPLATLLFILINSFLFYICKFAIDPRLKEIEEKEKNMTKQ